MVWIAVAFGGGFFAGIVATLIAAKRLKKWSPWS